MKKKLSGMKEKNLYDFAELKNEWKILKAFSSDWNQRYRKTVDWKNIFFASGSHACQVVLILTTVAGAALAAPEENMSS
jgi:hypothetical protein